jgi:hypothetical protein
MTRRRITPVQGRPLRALTSRGATLVAALLIAVGICASAALAVVHDYEGYPGGWPRCINWNTEYLSYSNYAIWNRVYRPTPRTYALYYDGGAQYATNASDNPFWHNQSGGYTMSHGADVDDGNHSGQCTVTFQYGT